MYASGYNRLFWGMLFIIFDINLGPINILPNFVGYLLFYSGLNILSGQHKIFEKGKPISVILVFLTIKDIIKFPEQGLTQFTALNYANMLLGSATTILNLYLIYITCRGIYLLYEEIGLEEQKEGVKSCWRFYFVIQIIMMFFTPFLMNLRRDYGSLMLLGVIVGIIASVLVTLLFRRARTELGGL